MKKIFKKDFIINNNVSIYEGGVTTTDRIKLTKLQDGEKISIMSDAMLKLC